MRLQKFTFWVGSGTELRPDLEAVPAWPVMTESGADHELWGWENFFREIERFIGESERQFGNCNEDYAQYAIERFEFCTLSVIRLRDHLTLHREPTASPETREVLSHYQNALESLLSCFRELSQKWLEHQELQEQLSASTAYRVAQESVTSRRGRPSFVISRDQLEYLRSLSFS